MHALEPSTLTRAPHPFDQSSADIILRSSDSVHFHVHSHILAQVSPVFATMLELPQPAAPSSDLMRVCPVIDMTEDSKALEPLLRLCYPAGLGTDEPELNHLHEIQPALEAAIKYDMARPTEELAARFLTCAPQSALEVWAFGCRHGLEHVARGGAEALWKALPRDARERERLFFPLDIPPSLRGLKGISAGQYFRLLQFVRCGRVLPGAAATASVSSDSPMLRRGETGTTCPHVDSDGAWQFLRPPAVVAAPNVRAKRGAFVYITVTESERLRSPENPSVEVHAPDVVCRCKDGSELRAHQQLLSRHSPVLKAQIATLVAPQPEGSTNSTDEPAQAAALPALELEGPSQAVCTLLCICYQSQDGPHWSGLPRSRLGCIELLAVATKYQVKPAIDLALARWKALARIHQPSTGTHGVPLLRTAVAAAAATPVALGWCPPLRSRLDEYSGILEVLPALTYHRLFVYLDACVRAAAEALGSAAEAWERVAAERTRRAAGGLPDGDSEAVARMYRVITDALDRRREAVERQEVAPMADHARALRLASYSGVVGPVSPRKRLQEDLKGVLGSLSREIGDAAYVSASCASRLERDG